MCVRPKVEFWMYAFLLVSNEWAYFCVGYYHWHTGIYIPFIVVDSLCFLAPVSMLIL